MTLEHKLNRILKNQEEIKERLTKIEHFTGLTTMAKFAQYFKKVDRENLKNTNKTSAKQSNMKEKIKAKDAFQFELTPA